MADGLTVAVHTFGDSAVMELAGNLDGTAARTVADAWAEASSGAMRRIVLDFSAVHYMNSTGIALIVELLREARASGCELRARGLSSHYRQIFEITRLTDFIALDEGTASAGATAPA